MTARSFPHSLPHFEATPMPSSPTQPRSGGSLAYRLMLGTAVAALLCFGLTAAISYWQSSRALIASAQTTMQNAARYQAEQIGSELGQAFTTGQSVASALLAQRAHGGVSREAASAIVHDQLQNHPEWVGMGTLWEPQAFDGKDGDYVDAEGHDNTGRFMTYWAYNGQSLIREPLVGYEKPGDGDWNLKPRELGRQIVAGPYDYQIGGKPVLMTTLSTPILDQGKYVGVVSVDFALAALQKRLSALRPMDDGYVELISPAGVILASRDAARIGKPADGADYRAMLAATRAGKDYLDFTPDAAGTVSAYVPLQIGQAQERFALGVVVPYAAIMQQAHRLLWTILAVGLGSALVLSLALFALLRRQVVGPLDAAAKVADAIASGKLDNQIAAQRQDEVGRLMGAMQRMQTDLRQRIERDAQIANENLRIRTALEHSEMEVLLADEQHTAVFITEALHTSFKCGEAAFHAKGQQGFSADAVVGKPLDYVFGTDAEGKARLQRLQQLQSTTLERYTFGPVTLDLTMTPLYAADAFDALYDASGGVPRRLNVLAGRVLLQAAIEGVELIGRQTVESVAADMAADMSAGREAPMPIAVEPEPVAPIFNSAARLGDPLFSAGTLRNGLGLNGQATVAPTQPDPITRVTPESQSVPRSTHRVVAPPPAPEPVSLRPMPTPAARPPVAAEEPVPVTKPSTDAALESRIAQLEARLEQQEAALRRVLTLLVDWSEIDNRGEERREAGAAIRPGAWGHAA